MQSDYCEVVRGEGDLLVIRLSDSGKQKFIKQGDVVELEFEDGRTITAKQQRKCYALINAVNISYGNNDKKLTKTQLKNDFCHKNGIATKFSLANCSVTRANEFISYLIDFCIGWGIPFSSQLLDQIQGQYGWERICLKHRQCCVCGKKAEYAHVHAVGIGRNRNHINNIGNRIMPLCAKHHHIQHTIGINTFMKRYQVKGVEVTDAIQRRLKIGKWNVSYEEPIIMTREDE